MIYRYEVEINSTNLVGEPSSLYIPNFKPIQNISGIVIQNRGYKEGKSSFLEDIIEFGDIDSEEYEFKDPYFVKKEKILLNIELEEDRTSHGTFLELGDCALVSISKKITVIHKVNYFTFLDNKRKDEFIPVSYIIKLLTEKITDLDLIVLEEYKIRKNKVALRILFDDFNIRLGFNNNYYVNQIQSELSINSNLHKNYKELEYLGQDESYFLDLRSALIDLDINDLNNKLKYLKTLR